MVSRMLTSAALILAAGLIAGIIGFAGMAGTLAPIAQAVFFLCLVVSLGLLLARLVRGPRVPRQH